MSQELATRSASVPADLQEKVLLGGDLAKLTPPERLSYYNAVCTSVGLNPLTRPFEYLILGHGDEKRMVLYARKDCTDQLRDLHGISVEIVSREVIDGVCVVTARAKNMTDRIDESVGAVPFLKENGEWKSTQGGKSYFKTDGTYSPLGLADRSNAMMKAETKAKRRVTLSICGLGIFDESEIDTMPEAKRAVHAEDPDKKFTRAELIALTHEQEEKPAPASEPGMAGGYDSPKDAPAQAERTGDPPPAPTDSPADNPMVEHGNAISLAKSIRECSDALNAMEKDTRLDLFEKTQLREEGQNKLKELKAKK